jgi:hypothetical protein
MSAHATREKTATEGHPVTLEQADAQLRRRRPERRAPVEQWRAFHLCAAQMYATVADVDARHHNEALALAALAEHDANQPDAGRPSVVQLVPQQRSTNRLAPTRDRSQVRENHGGNV